MLIPKKELGIAAGVTILVVIGAIVLAMTTGSEPAVDEGESIEEELVEIESELDLDGTIVDNFVDDYFTEQDIIDFCHILDQLGMEETWHLFYESYGEFDDGSVHPVFQVPSTRDVFWEMTLRC